MNDTSFRFLHLSDLHLCQEANRRNFMSLFEKQPVKTIDVLNSAVVNGALSLVHPTSYVKDRLAALSEFVQLRPDVYDGILISGDLATSGTAVDHAIAFQYVDGTPIKNFRDHDGLLVLGRGDTTVVVCPGNHDNYGGNLPFSPSNRNFTLKFGKYLPKFEDFVGHKVFIGNDTALAVIYADFGFQQRKDPRSLKHYWGGGHVHQHVLAEMVRRTIRFRLTKSFEQKLRSVMWMIHFAPYDCGDTSLELTNRDLVIKSAAENGVKNIICGHTHKAKNEIDIETGVTAYCAGSATAVECNNAIHEIDYDLSNDQISITNYNWNNSQKAFKK